MRTSPDVLRNGLWATSSTILRFSIRGSRGARLLLPERLARTQHIPGPGPHRRHIDEDSILWSGRGPEYRLPTNSKKCMATSLTRIERVVT